MCCDRCWSSLSKYTSNLPQHFSDRLLVLVRNDTFDAEGYFGLFGVRHAGGQRYWPAICYRELTDDLIVGHGERPLAVALERALDGADN